MKIILLITITLLTACNTDSEFTTSHPMAESDIFLNFAASDEAIDMIVGTVISKGWQCDSISSLRVESSGYSLTCNGYRYGYSLINHGGSWKVEVN